MAVDRTQPNGRVLGVDIIPAQPPRGVSTIQGNFLAPEIQAYIQEFLRDPNRGRPHYHRSLPDTASNAVISQSSVKDSSEKTTQVYEGSIAYEKFEGAHESNSKIETTVDVVLSDMSAPWYQTTGFWKRSLSDPHNRMMNTSGVTFKDHAGSMVCPYLYCPAHVIIG